MTRAAVVFRKELKDTLRDKRTLIMMIVLPLFIIPVLMFTLVKVAEIQERKATEKTLTVAIVGAEFAPELTARFEADSQMTVVTDVPVDSLEARIRDKTLDGGVVIRESFPERIAADRQAAIQVYFQSTSSLGITGRRIDAIINGYDDDIVSARIARLELDERLFDAIEIVTVDVSTLQEVLGKTIGGFLPYMFILFMFTGSMYPGIDLGAGEKERGTLETLLSSPASKLEIVLGKFMVIGLVGLASALLSMVGLYLGVQVVADIPPEVADVIYDVLSLKVVLLIATLLLPLEVFFAAIILAISIYAKSFKEAQSSLTPLSIAVIAPVAIGVMPGVELNLTTALVPVLNVSLATKDVVSGTINPVHIGLTYLSLFALAAVAVAFCVHWFSREGTLFRT